MINQFFSVGMAVVLALCPGCAQLEAFSKSPNGQRLAIIAGLAVEVGTSVYLDMHPEHRPAFALAIQALEAMRLAGGTNETAFTTLLSSLPTSTFEGPLGDFYVSKKMVVWDGETKKASNVPQGSTMPVMRSVMAGLRRGVVTRLEASDGPGSRVEGAQKGKREGGKAGAGPTAAGWNLLALPPAWPGAAPRHEPTVTSAK